MRTTSAPLLGLSMMVALLIGCGPKPQPEPKSQLTRSEDHLSADEHDKEAKRHEAEAKQHEATYDPRAKDLRERCNSAAQRTGVTEPCWTSSVNPTASQVKEAELDRKAAEEHRAKSAALRDAEAKACADVSAMNVEVSPFEHLGDIESVAPGEEPDGKGANVLVVFKGISGLSVSWMQKELDCHLARNAALGHKAPEAPWCPLVPPHVTAKAMAMGSGVGVKVSTTDKETLDEFKKRVAQLKQRVSAK